MANVDYGKTRDVLRQLTQQSSSFSRLCVVNSVDETELLCDVSPVENLDIEYFDVQLSATKDGTIVNIPKVGANVIISFIDEDNAFVSMFSEIEKQIVGTKDDTLLSIFEDLFLAIDHMQHNTAQGPTVPLPINKAEFDAILQRIKGMYLK